MKRNLEKVLIFGATSSMATDLIKRLINDNVTVYAISRSAVEFEHPNLFKLRADLSKEDDINYIFSSLNNIVFDSVICFQGVAITSPVEFLKKDELQKQLDISLFSLLAILKNIKSRIKRNGLVVNISSMASFGLFPFLAPYEISKASSDMLLTSYEIETGIKTVSVKPGVVGTKFWNFCIKENSDNLNSFKDEYAPIASFLKNNALNNSSKGLEAKDVSNLIYKILYKNNPKHSYLIGHDCKMAALMSLFKGRCLFWLIREILKKRIKNDR